MGKLAERVYQKLRQVPAGRVTTYKELAQTCETRGYRAVGQILACNPMAPEVPCHRVVKSNGEIGGFRGGTSQVADKIKMLKNEGVLVKEGKVENFEKIMYHI